MVSSKALTNISQHRTDSKFRLSDSFFLKTLKVYGQSIDLDFLLTESHCNYNISHDISLSYSHLNFFFSWDLWITSCGVTKWFQVFKSQILPFHPSLKVFLIFFSIFLLLLNFQDPRLHFLLFSPKYFQNTYGKSCKEVKNI